MSHAWALVKNAINTTSYCMRYCFLLLISLFLTACTVSLEVEELPKIEVEHKVILPESDSVIPHQCDNLVNVEISKFFEAGLCTDYQKEYYTCCVFRYNETCTVSFCTMIKEKYEKYCTIISDNCEF